MNWLATRCSAAISVATRGFAPRWEVLAQPCAVDDIRGFQNAFVNGVQQAVSASNPLTVAVGANAYTLVGARRMPPTSRLHPMASPAS